MSGEQINDILSNQLLQATNLIEKEVDQQLEKFTELGDMTFDKFSSEIDAIRLKRLAAMKKDAEMRKIYLAKGHGSYDELSNEKEFFQTTKTSEKVIIHFYEQSNMKCKIIDHHFKKMSSKHVETKFVKIEVSKVPFLKENFRLKTTPTIIIVIDNIVKARISQFDDIINIEEHSYKMLEWKMAKLEGLNYDEDLTKPPEANKPQKKSLKTIRGPAYDSSESDFSD